MVALFAGLLALPSLALAQQEQQEPEVQNFQGVLLSVDTEERTLTIQDSDERLMTFAYNDETEVVGSEDGVQGLSSESGTPVRASYLPPAPGQMTLALTVTILEEEQ
jgi:hypothetical protein